MKASISKVEQVSAINLAPGEFSGVWSGYQIELDDRANGLIRIHISQGIRGRARCIVKSDGTNNLTIEKVVSTL
jgi:hypothetical protein